MLPAYVISKNYNRFIIKGRKTQKRYNIVFYKVILHFKMLQNDITDSRTVSVFKNKLKIYLSSLNSLE